MYGVFALIFNIVSYFKIYLIIACREAVGDIYRSSQVGDALVVYVLAAVPITGIVILGALTDFFVECAEVVGLLFAVALDDELGFLILDKVAESHIFDLCIYREILVNCGLLGKLDILYNKSVAQMVTQIIVLGDAILQVNGVTVFIVETAAFCLICSFLEMVSYTSIEALIKVRCMSAESFLL